MPLEPITCAALLDSIVLRVENRRWLERVERNKIDENGPNSQVREGPWFVAKEIMGMENGVIIRSFGS